MKYEVVESEDYGDKEDRKRVTLRLKRSKIKARVAGILDIPKRSHKREYSKS